MLEQECEATARYIGELLKRSAGPQHDPVPDASIDLFVCHLASMLKSLVALMKQRALEEVRMGRRAIPVHVMAAEADSLVAQASKYAAIEALAERLAFAHGWTPKMFFGYVLVREGEEQRVVYPPIQTHLAAIQQALEAAKVTPQGKFISTLSPDGVHRVTLQASYPTYAVYTVEERQSPLSSRWSQVERVGRDALVAALADAYHKGYWFVQQSVAWKSY